jgi:hypothetical protein
MEHFQIIVNAMLSWSDEAKAPKKVPARSPVAMSPRDELDDDDEMIDDDDDFEPDEELNVKAEGGEPAEVELPVSEPVD